MSGKIVYRSFLENICAREELKEDAAETLLRMIGETVVTGSWQLWRAEERWDLDIPDNDIESKELLISPIVGRFGRPDELTHGGFVERTASLAGGQRQGGLQRGYSGEMQELQEKDISSLST